MCATNAGGGCSAIFSSILMKFDLMLFIAFFLFALALKFDTHYARKLLTNITKEQLIVEILPRNIFQPTERELGKFES